MLAAEGLDARALLGDAGIDPVALEAPAALLSRGRSGQRLRGGEGDARLLDGCTVRARETVGWARELLGGNGILLDHHVGTNAALASPPVDARLANAVAFSRASSSISSTMPAPRPS
jgi:hypothetical protein